MPNFDLMSVDSLDMSDVEVNCKRMKGEEYDRFMEEEKGDMIICGAYLERYKSKFIRKPIQDDKMNNIQV